MANYELFFHYMETDKTYSENKTIISTFESIESLKENYILYLGEYFPINEWMIFNFDERIKEIQANDSVILAINQVAFFQAALKDKEFNDLNLSNKVPKALCVELL